MKLIIIFRSSAGVDTPTLVLIPEEEEMDKQDTTQQEQWNTENFDTLNQDTQSLNQEPAKFKFLSNDNSAKGIVNQIATLLNNWHCNDIVFASYLNTMTGYGRSALSLVNTMNQEANLIIRFLPIGYSLRPRAWTSSLQPEVRYFNNSLTIVTI